MTAYEHKIYQCRMMKKGDTIKKAISRKLGSTHGTPIPVERNLLAPASDGEFDSRVSRLQGHTVSHRASERSSASKAISQSEDCHYAPRGWLSASAALERSLGNGARSRATQMRSPLSSTTLSVAVSVVQDQHENQSRMPPNNAQTYIYAAQMSKEVPRDSDINGDEFDLLHNPGAKISLITSVDRNCP